LDQIDAEAATIIAQAKAPAPVISVFYRYKVLILSLDPVITAALITGASMICSAIISNPDKLLPMFV
jgi:hypothetical protein